METLRLAATSLVALLLTVASVVAQESSPLVGSWSGAIETPGAPLSVTVRFEAGAGGLRGTIDIPMQGARGLALTKVSVTGADVAFTIGGVPGDPTFRGTLDGDRLAGTFSQGGATFPFLLTRATAAAPATTSPSERARLDSIRAFLAGAIGRWDVPGIGVAIVRDGKVVLAEGFGLRDIASKSPMSASTLMPIGSTTKSFTAFVIGTLVDEGKLDWDTPVVDYLPEFRVADEQTTRELRVRDLLTHVSGLPRHDMVWYGSSLSRAELFARLRHLESSAPPRTTWQYQNLMYMTAGVLAERVSGRSWETLVRERIFEPLGMRTATTSLDELRRSDDRAVGYEKRKKGLEAVEYRSAEALGSAGSINASAAEMARWVQLQIDGGEHAGKKLIGATTLQEIHAPQVVMPSSPRLSGDRVLFDLYAMGWMEHAYRGRRMLEHGGNIDGFSAIAGFLPGERIGVVVLANRGGTGLPTAAMYTIFDILLDERDYDWEAKALAVSDDLDSTLRANRELADDGIRVPNTRPSHAIADYAGEFEHPAYGVITVTASRDRLRADLHGLASDLEHYHYDQFRLTGGDGLFEGMIFEFRTSKTGDIAALVAPLEPAVEPIVFTRRASASLSNPAVLDRYAGTYTIAGMTISIHRRDSTLYTTVPGQPEYELVPTAEATFDLEGMPGYTVRFTPRSGRADRVILIQPNGTFTADRTE